MATKTSTAPTVRKTFPVLEMSCAACAVSVESILKSQKGVLNAQVNYADTSAVVEFVTAETTVEQLKQAVQSGGYDLIIEEENTQELKEEAEQNRAEALRKRVIGASILSFPVMILGMFFMDMPYVNWIMMALSAPVVFGFGGTYFVHAWKQLKHRTSNMDTLVALSTGIAFVFSAFNTIYPEFWHKRGLHPHVYFEAAAVVIAFISLGKWFEERAKSNTTTAIKKLMGLQPKTVRILCSHPDSSGRGGNETEIAIADVKVSDIIIVRPGEKIAVDGEVVLGESFVDESMISGEPLAVLKNQGTKVFSGTINQKGSFQFRAEKVGGDTVLANIIRMVQQAQSSKAPVQQLVDKISAIFVPVVIGISILTFVAWMVLGGENGFSYGLLSAVTVLVIACPCALGLATPTAIMVGVGKGAENNILIKDAESLEKAHNIDVVILDKTGTITEGKPSVTDSIWSENATFEHKMILFTMESQSEHPLAEAVVLGLKKDFNDIKMLVLDSFKSVTGKGVIAEKEDKKYFIGSLKWINELGISEPSREIGTGSHYNTIFKQWQDEAKTVVVFSDEKQFLAAFAISDKIKATSIEAIKTLQNRGIDVVMLTGDNKATAYAVAKQIGVKDFRAEVMPSDKAAIVGLFQKQGKTVAMVGDGINDSQALAQADVSIAMGKGSDIAMDVAKMTLITSDLNTIPKALKLSKQTVKTIRQNLFWAFIYNIIGIPIAAGVLYPYNGFLLNPMIASAAMALSSVSVVTNSLRLKFLKL
jgi:P-type Cu2+ transporter